MPPRFKRSAAAYAKDGQRYVVQDIEDGIVYCLTSGGAETEFPETQLFNEAEWAARTGSKPDRLYGAIRQSTFYAPYKGKLGRVPSERLLAKAETLVPGVLDYAAFVIAERVLADTGAGSAQDLSIRKCREIFDAAGPESRAAILAGLIGSPAELLVGTVDRGDNLLRAMIGKIADAGSIPFDLFRTAPRR
jgi:hypothetical protein